MGKASRSKWEKRATMPEEKKKVFKKQEKLKQPTKQSVGVSEAHE